MPESRFRLAQALKLTVRFDVIKNRERKDNGEAFGLTKYRLKWHKLSYIIPTVYIAARFGSLARSLASRSIRQRRAKRSGLLSENDITLSTVVSVVSAGSLVSE